MVSMSQLRDRKSNFDVQDWILDSGAFTEVARFGGYRSAVEEYAKAIARWSVCGNLLIAVAQDWMCEPFVIQKTGLSISEHQRLTIERYDQLLSCTESPPDAIMPVLQGYKISDYLDHLLSYGDRLKHGQWIGVGSVCRRNGKPDEVREILRTIKLLRPDLRLHGFGLKLLAVQNPDVKSLLYSCDSMAWSVPRKFGDPRSEIELAHEYQDKIKSQKISRATSTSGAGNGQGRKCLWKAGKTKAIRVPEVFADDLLKIAKQWDNVQNHAPVFK